MEKLKSQVPANVPFLSMEQTVKALDCSRSFVYGLIDEGILTPKYIKRKPYFMIEDIVKAMTGKEENGQQQ